MKNTIKKTVLSLALLSATNLMASDFIGKVVKVDNGFLLEAENGVTREIILPKKYQYSLPSTVSEYLQRYSGKLKGNKIIASEISTTIGGVETKKGFLELGEDGNLYLDGDEVVFREGKVLNGHKFDQNSINFFINKKVEVEGKYVDIEGKGSILQIGTIIPADLFSAADEDRLPEIVEKGFEGKSPFSFLLNEFPLNEYAQSEKAFRKTIYKKEVQTDIKPGEKALIVTLSGRTGDAIGSSAGHFVAGRATVREDLTLDGDIFNSYVPNKKEIFSSNTSLPYYYGHVVGGQNVHRPTYTLVIYGDKMEKITKRVRDMVDLENPKLRVQKDSITPTYNCTTINMKALKKAGFYGNHDRFFKKVFDVQNLAYINPLYYVMNHNKGAGAISYALATDAERFIPRNAFESYIKVLNNKRFRKKLGIKRVDFIYFNQIPSTRPVGGIPYLGVRKALKVVDFVKQDRVYDQEIAHFLKSLGEKPGSKSAKE